MGRTLSLALIGLAVPLAAGAAARPAPVRSVQPKEYVSPSGELALFVDPTERLGEGPGRYTLRRGGEELWSVELPFTLREARVTDAGWTAGYAYPADRSTRPMTSSFRVVSLSPGGNVVLDDVTPRTTSRFVHAAPNPLARGLFLDPGSDRFVVRVADPDLNRGFEEWWEYRLSEPERIAILRPEELLVRDRGLSLRGGDFLRDVPLRLALWSYPGAGRRREPGGAPETGVLSLVDDEGRTVWLVSRPDDSIVLAADADENALGGGLKATGALIAVGPGGRFSIGRLERRERIDLRVRRNADDTGWELDELARGPYEPPAPVEEAEPAAPTPIDLPRVGRVRLEGASGDATSPFGPIEAFAFDAESRFRVLRRGSERGTSELFLVSREGEVLREARTAPFAGGYGLVRGWPLSRGRWLVAGAPEGPVRECALWFADEASGELAPLPNRWPLFTDVSPTADGGFAALASFPSGFTSARALLRIDASGREVWRVSEERGDDTKPADPESVAVTPAGLVVVVGPLHGKIQVFDADGGYLRSLDLSRLLDVPAKYANDLSSDPSGGLLFEDFGTLLRLRADGELLSTVRVSPKDGRPLGRLASRARVAPDGTVWTTDDEAFFRIDAGGDLAEAVGNVRSLETIADLGGTTIDRTGRILIQDTETGALHAFGPGGQRAWIARPAEGDFDKSLIRKIFVDREGHAYVQAPGPRFGLAERLVEFTAGGERVGFADLGSGTVAFPRERSVWVLEHSYDHVGLRLLHGDEILAEITRRPDGRWLEWIADVDTDDAGKLVVLQEVVGDSEPGLAIYAADGSPESWLPAISGSNLAVSRDWLAVWEFRSDVTLVRRSDGRAFAFTAPADAPRAFWHFGFSPDGTELWGVESDGPTLHRFALP